MLRLAVALDRRQIGALARVECEYLPEVQEYKMRIIPTRPDDNCDLELWSLDYKKGVFEAEFGVKLVVLESSTGAVS